MCLAPLGRLCKPTMQNLFQKHPLRARLYYQATQQGQGGVIKRVVKIQSVLLYEQPFLRYSLFKGHMLFCLLCMCGCECTCVHPQQYQLGPLWHVSFKKERETHGGSLSLSLALSIFNLNHTI